MRERKTKPLPGNSEVKTFVKMTLLWHLQDWQGILDMEETAILAARALVLPTSGRQDRAEAVYYWLGLANERLAQQLSLLGVDVREHHHAKRALELYQQQLAVTQEYGSRAQEAKAHGNLANAHILKGDYARGCQLIQQALAVFQALGDWASAAVALQTLITVAGHAGPAAGCDWGEAHWRDLLYGEDAAGKEEEEEEEEGEPRKRRWRHG